MLGHVGIAGGRSHVGSNLIGSKTRRHGRVTLSEVVLVGVWFGRFGGLGLDNLVSGRGTVCVIVSIARFIVNLCQLFGAGAGRHAP